MSQPFASGGQSTGVSASASFLPFKEHPGLISFRMDWLDLLAVQGNCQESSPTPQFKSINSSALSLLHSPSLTSKYDYWKNYSFDLQTFVGKEMSLLFNTLFRLVITFLPRSKSFNFMAAVTIWSDFRAQEIKSVSVSIISPSICHEVMGPDAMVLVF